jgi:type II secretory pathway component GspD/PulD (secretin)
MLVKTLRIAGLLAILACTGPSAQAATLLDSLVWEDGVLILGFDGPFESRSLVMEGPDRIVLDFPDVRSTLAQAAYPGEGALVGIRVGQNEPEEPGGLKARVVLDLAGPQHFLTELGDRSLRLVLSPAAPAAATAASARVEATLPVAPHEPAPAAPASESSLALVAGESLPAPPDQPLVATPAPVSAPAVAASEPAVTPAPALRQASFSNMSALPLAEALPEAAPLAPAAQLHREDPAPAAMEAAASQEFARLSEGEQAAVAVDPTTVMFASDPVFVAGDPVALPSEFAGAPADPFEAALPFAAPAPVATPAAAAAASQAPVAAETPLLVADAGLSFGSSLPLAPAAPAPVEQSTPSVAAAAVATPSIAQSQSSTPGVAATGAQRREAALERALTVAAAAEEVGASPVQSPAFSRPVQLAQADAAPAAKAERGPEPLLLSGQRKVKGDDALITLEMRGAEFRTLLHAFSEFADVNIVAGKDVQGKVSVHLTGVPWRKALAAVCSANGYTVKEEYGVLRVAPRGSLLQEEMELLTAERKRSEYMPLETRVIKLSYAVAQELTEPLAKMLSERGKMDVDERTNAILVTDLPENVAMVVSLAHELDLLMPQVEITARIVDLDYRASRDLGVRWDALNVTNGDLGVAGGGTVDGSFTSPAADVEVGIVRSWGELNVALQALELANKANIISTPRVTTMDNREANILVGKKIPLIVADEAGNAITQLTTIGIKMVVTPHINPDGKIMMQVLTEVSDLASEATVQGGVIITTSESKTNVMVDNGSTAVIAGLIKSSDSSLDRGVPFLGKLPILGHLFGYSNKNDSKRELIIFITPRIVDPSATSTEADLRDQGYTLPLGG